MQLRNLEKKDVSLIERLMEDSSGSPQMRSVLFGKFGEEMQNYIESGRNDATSEVYRVIASDEDEYQGEVCIKNIAEGTGELAIAVRPEAMGRGYAWFGLKEIINIAFNDFGLDSLYWCISRDNKRAVRFCDKHHFKEVVDIPPNVQRRYSGIGNLKWYSILKGDEFNVPETVAGCKVIHIKTISTVDSGELSYFEGLNDIPFEIKRIYYISKVPEGTRRGFHAHKNLKQVLFCPYGRIQLVLENKEGREEIELTDPSLGIIIEKPTWREMLWLQKDSVLCVAASDYYDVGDYIRDYDEFRSTYVNNNKCQN